MSKFNADINRIEAEGQESLSVYESVLNRQLYLLEVIEANTRKV
jgi:hypothetical protein